jgi:WD40 repeat protein
MDLELAAVIGFSGSVIQGLMLHPDNEHLVYPLGSTIVVRHIVSRSQHFLRGHDQRISCVTLSKTGNYLASGQQTHMGFQAEIVLWDFYRKEQLHRFRLHKVLIQSIHFSYDEQYLASIGGKDDLMLVVWDVQSGKPLCGAKVGHEEAHQVKFFNAANNRLMTVQDNRVRIWDADYVAKKLKYTDVNLGSLKRQISNLVIDPTDHFAYVGTQTGDILEVSIDRAIFKRSGPAKRLLSLGVQTLSLLPNGDILAGAGDGSLVKLNIQNLQTKAQCSVLGAVTSISLTADGTNMFVGTSQSNMYWVDSDQLQAELRNTCHYERINDIAFPYNYSEVFATCSVNDIRVWNARNRQELLRIQVPNLECFCVAFMQDGKSIISGWNDGKIRSFLPQSGRMMYVINDAHHHGVTALTTTSDCTRVVSGGMEGEVRIWKIGRQTQTLEASMKEHRGRVWAIQIKASNEQAVSASSDGSCIVWDIQSFTRLICLFESTMFKQVQYHPDESQLITTGSDRKITYWDCYDGQAIRMLDGSEEGEVNTLAITRQGEHFASGGEDQTLKVWSYDDGTVLYQGVGHSASITKVVFSPDQRNLVSVGAEGAILIWTVPEEVQTASSNALMPERELTLS